MYNGLARKQVSLSEQECCYVRADLTLQRDAEGRCEGDFHWNNNSFGTDMAAPPPPARPQSGLLLQRLAETPGFSCELQRGPGNVSKAWVQGLVWV